jgi:hypothetical protein
MVAFFIYIKFFFFLTLGFLIARGIAWILEKIFHMNLYEPTITQKHERHMGVPLDLKKQKISQKNLKDNL